MTCQIPTAVKQQLPSVISFGRHPTSEACDLFSCELLLVNRKGCDSLPLNSDKINLVQRARYLGDLLCEDRADRAKTTVIEFCALSKGINFGHETN